MGGTLILEMVKSRFTGVFYIGKTITKNFLLFFFQIFLHHRGATSEGDGTDFPKIGPKSGIRTDISRILGIRHQKSIDLLSNAGQKLVNSSL